PLRPLMDRIAKISTREQLYQEITHLASESFQAPFLVVPIADKDEPSRMIVAIGPAPLGLPDRDYYLKDDQKSRPTRDRYREHVKPLLALAAVPREDAAKAIIAMETKFAQATMSRVDQRDPYKVNTKVEADKLSGFTPHFPWKAHFRAVGLSYSGPVNVRDVA